MKPDEFFNFQTETPPGQGAPFEPGEPGAGETPQPKGFQMAHNCIVGWLPIETCDAGQYEKVDLWVVNRKTGRQWRIANAYRTGRGYWLEEGRNISGKKVWDRDEDEFYLDIDATDHESIVVTHWHPVPNGPSPELIEIALEKIDCLRKQPSYQSD